MNLDMSVDGESLPAPAAMTSVAVAVKGGGNGSRRAVRWAVKNLLPESEHFVLVHVMPTITSIPTPSGNHIPIEDLDANVVAMYVEDMKLKLDETFIPFKRLCKARKVETLILEDDNPASALVQYISDSGVRSLVLGYCSSNCIIRKLKGPQVPSVVVKNAPETCNMYVVSRHRLITNSANLLSTSESSSKHWLFPRRVLRSLSIRRVKHGLYSYSMECKVQNISGGSSVSDLSYLNAKAFGHETSDAIQERNHHSFEGSSSEIQIVNGCPSTVSTDTAQTNTQAEVEQLRLELHNTVALYNRTCEDLVHAQNKVHLLSSEYLEEARRVKAAIRREETFRKIATEEKEKRLEAIKEVEIAKNLLSKEAYERQIAELKALTESLEKQKIVDGLFFNDKRYRRYSRDEIEIATDFFSETRMIGEGSYGKVYKCNLDQTPVAIKVLRSDAAEKKEEFLREVEVLSKLRHPNMVLLLGACPESGCLVYEYMENGSLEDHIYHQRTRPPLPWHVRFRIAFEVACGLAFLHNSKPEPIVHRDLKPGNILLDRNYMSKIGDVGLAKFISDVVPDNITEYRESIIAGTLFYMDPEYQRTGTIRPKSDLYAFGIITMQLLTSHQPNGLLLKVENAISNGSISNVLDKAVTDWPLAEAEELAGMALKCSALRCRDRPDLETEVLPVLKKLADTANASTRVERNNLDPPSHYFCPILQEVMDDPHIAADGFTYEHRAIKAWLERHNVSPVTKLRLQHTMLTPNHALRSAIQDWLSRRSSSSA